MSAELTRIVETLSRVADPTEAEIGRALGIALEQTAAYKPMVYFEQRMGGEVFERAELRRNTASGLAYVLLHARRSAPLHESSIDIQAFGIPVPIFNPRVPPKGTASYVYDRGGMEMTLEFDAHTRVLLSASFAWEPRS